MSVTVADLMELPSLRQAKVLAGHRGLNKIVTSISVLESIDPSVLVDGLFPQGEFYGSEIVITGFLNSVDDVDCQCMNIRRLAEGGEVGLILFYVGIYMKKVDRRLIELANELDFVLISMPEGQINLRYGEVINEVTEKISADKSHDNAIVADILARVFSLPAHLQTINTVTKMLSDYIQTSVILTNSRGDILNLAAWPRGNEENLEKDFKGKNIENDICRLPIQLYSEQSAELIVFKEKGNINESVLIQAADVVRICMNIWGKNHDEVAVHELVRAIIQDEPIKMRRLADIFNIDVASIHEMWVLRGADDSFAAGQRGQLAGIVELMKGMVDTVVADIYENSLLLLINTPRTLKAAEETAAALLNIAGRDDVTLTRCTCLQSSLDVRNSYLAHEKSIDAAKKVFPLRRTFDMGDILFCGECLEIIEKGEAAAEERLSVLEPLKKEEKADLAETLQTFFLDADLSVTRTSKLMFVHVNTIKYRLQRMSDLLGFHIDRMPGAVNLYEGAAILRLLK